MFYRLKWLGGDGRIRSAMPAAVLFLSSCGLSAPSCSVADQNSVTLRSVALENAIDWLPRHIRREDYQKEIDALLDNDCCSMKRRADNGIYELIFLPIRNLISIVTFLIIIGQSPARIGWPKL